MPRYIKNTKYSTCTMGFNDVSDGEGMNAACIGGGGGGGGGGREGNVRGVTDSRN